MKPYAFLKFSLIGLLIAIFLSACSPTTSLVSSPNTTNKTALRIHRLLPNYAKLARESWLPIHTTLPLKIGNANVNIPLIRHRLVLLGDISQQYASKSTQFDLSLEYGILQFQWRHGLQTTGVINQKTLDALNISPKQRYEELAKSMQEWAKLPDNEGSRYIHINIPSFTMNMIQNGQSIMEMKVITGRFSRPTPTLYSRVTTIVFNPSWNVPPTIVAKDVIPGMRKNPNYLKEHNDLKVYSNWDKNAAEIDPLTIDWQNANGHDFQYRLTAAPGDKNPLGRVKFIFENDHDVYMHDTPEKPLFAQIQRAYSSGCIRLEKPFQLVEYFFNDNSDLNHELVNHYLSSNQTKYIQLKNPMPIYVTYIMAWVDANDRVHFREDIYKNSPSNPHPE